MIKKLIKKEDKYISEDTKENQAIKMFEKLKKHIGENVTCKTFLYGEPHYVQGELKEVNYFNNVVVEYSGIPFVGYNYAISSIVLEETEEELYNNPHIEDGYNRKKSEDVEDSQRKIFGDTVVDKQKERRIKQQETIKQAIEKEKQNIKKRKFELMKEGLKLIKPETAYEWFEFAYDNCNDAHSTSIVKATISMMKKLENGISFEEAENQVFDKELGLTIFMIYETTNAVFRFAKNGDEYRQYCNQRYGIINTEKKTANTPVLTLSPKK